MSCCHGDRGSRWIDGRARAVAVGGPRLALPLSPLSAYLSLLICSHKLCVSLLCGLVAAALSVTRPPPRTVGPFGRLSDVAAALLLCRTARILPCESSHNESQTARSCERFAGYVRRGSLATVTGTATVVTEVMQLRQISYPVMRRLRLRFDRTPTIRRLALRPGCGCTSA